MELSRFAPQCEMFCSKKVTHCHLFSLSFHTVVPPMAHQMEGKPLPRDCSRPHGGMSGESGQTEGVLHALGVVDSPQRTLLLNGS